MTEQERIVRDRLLQYGHLRTCACYHGTCLVIPEQLLEVMVRRIVRMIPASIEIKEKGVKTDD